MNNALTLVVNQGLLDLSLFPSTPSGFDLISGSIIGGIRTFTLTTTTVIAQGTSRVVQFLPNSLLSLLAASTATLSFISNPPGTGTEGGPGANTSSMSITGVSLGPLYGYSCS